MDVLNSIPAANPLGTSPRENVPLRSHRIHLSKDDKKPRLDCCLNHSMAGHPISLNININNSVVTTTNATIVAPTQKPHHSYQSSELTPRDVAAAALRSTRAHRLERTIFTGSSTFRGQSEEAAAPSVFTPAQALKKYGNRLSDYEKGEILDYQCAYFLGAGANKLSGDARSPFDDEKGYYNVVVGDQIAYRYEVLQYIGKGSFGQALKCFDHKEKRCVALKLIRSKKKLYHQANVEVKILKHIRDHDPEQRSCIVRLLDYFVFRKHIVTPPPSISCRSA